MSKALPFTAFVERALGAKLTLGQRTLCLVAFDGLEPKQLPSELRAIARQLFGKVDVVPDTARGAVFVVAGARAGKSYLAALRLLHLALTTQLDSLAAGEIASAVIVAPDVRLARQTLRYVAGALEATPALRSAVLGQTSDSVTLRRPQDGRSVIIECLPATRGGSALRGRTLVGAVCDEACFLRDSDSIVNDVEIYRALSPRIVKGGQLLMVSTPWGESGLLFEAWRDGFGKPRRQLVAHAPTALLRDDKATIAMVEAERERDPANAAREFDALFSANEEALLDAADLQACVDVGRESSPIERGKSYAIGVDLGVRQDSSAFAVAHHELRERQGAPPADVVVVDEVREYRPKSFVTGKVDLDVVEAELSATAKVARAIVHHDIYLADTFVPKLRQRGIRCREASMSSTEQARRAALLASMVREHRLRLPEHVELLKQLRQLRVTRHAGGRISVAAPRGRGKHDDLVDALLIALDAALALEPSGGDYIIRPAGFIWRGNAATSEVTPRQFFTNHPQAGFIRVPPPVWAKEHPQAQAERFARGISLPQDYAELGDAEVARRLGFGINVHVEK